MSDHAARQLGKMIAGAACFLSFSAIICTKGDGIDAFTLLVAAFTLTW
jgi:hypothetical protein